MQSKRAIVWLASALIGALITWFLVYQAWPVDIPGWEWSGPGNPDFHIGFGTDFYRFAYSNVLLLFLSAGSTAFIWLDYALGTEYLKR
jgi:hypothetical protein